MRNPRFATSLSCPKCEHISRRIFDTLMDEEILEMPIAYILFGWIACPREKCRNYFHKKSATSRCPVCTRWSVRLLSEGEQKNWRCLNKECGWEITLPNLD